MIWTTSTHDGPAAPKGDDHLARGNSRRSEKGKAAARAGVFSATWFPTLTMGAGQWPGSDVLEPAGDGPMMPMHAPPVAEQFGASPTPVEVSAIQ